MALYCIEMARWNQSKADMKTRKADIKTRNVINLLNSKSNKVFIKSFIICGCCVNSKEVHLYQEPILLTLISFNSSMDK